MLFSIIQNRHRKFKNNFQIIKKMKLELIRFGYKPREVDSIIRIASGSHPARTLSATQIKDIEKALENQLRIARKYFS